MPSRTAGAVPFAHAEHTSPYRRGAQVQGENSLPLGLVAAFAYPESTFTVKPGEQLTLMSDIVAETQNAQDHLFGSDRIADLLCAGTAASELASAAQIFGQEAHIIVLPRALQPAEVAHA